MCSCVPRVLPLIGAKLRCQPQQRDLYRAIAQRHTNRGPYEPDQAVPPALLAQLAAVSDDLAATRVFWFSTPAEREQFGAMVVRATEELIADDEQSTDNFVWQRQSWDAIHSHRDGITLETSGMPPAMAAAIKLLPPLSEKRSNTSWLNATRDLHVATAPVFGILAVRDSTDRVHQLQAGRRWQRMHLQATANGLALQPLNQPVERAVREEQLGLAPDFQARLADLTGSDWTALMTFRAGYPARAAIPSPRRDVNDVITDGAPG